MPSKSKGQAGAAVAPAADAAPLSLAEIRAALRAKAAPVAGAQPQVIFVPEFRREVVVWPGNGATKYAVQSDTWEAQRESGGDKVLTVLFLCSAIKHTVRDFVRDEKTQAVVPGEFYFHDMSVVEIAELEPATIWLLGEPAVRASAAGKSEGKADLPATGPTSG